MARKRKAESEAAPAPMSHNGPMPDDVVVQGFTHQIEEKYDRLASIKGEYMQRCKTIREDIARVLVEAKDAGIPKKEFKLVIRTRALENKLEHIRDDLEPDEAETFEAIRAALGDLADLPLGAAVLDRGGNRPSA
jgi:uncharacterized protein (UPF0335 family)